MRTAHRLAAALERRQVPVYLAALGLGVLLGMGVPSAESQLEAAIYPVLGCLLYVTFLQVPFDRLKAAFRDTRFLHAALGLNFAVVPFVAFGLSRFAPGGTGVELGVLLVLLTPCIDYVIVFTKLAGGSEQRLLAVAPVLMLVQMVLLPAYLYLMVGPELADVIDPAPFAEAFLLLIALPLALAWATETATAEHRVKAVADLTPVALMALTLTVVVASQWPRVEHDLGDVAGVIPIYVAFLAIMAFVGAALAKRLRFDAGAGRALVFTGATRNSLVVLPLALSLGDAYALAPAVVVTQTLVEVLGMVAYLKAVPALLPCRLHS